MTQEDKELLIKDISARLPYNVRVEYNGTTLTNIFDVLGIAHGRIMLCLPFMSKTECPLIEEVKPYLFPLSTMTKEQILVFWKIEFKDNGGFENDWDFPLYPPKVGNHFIIEALDWLNRNHFDYRGLIEKGLAIDATGLNIY